jgi:multidrug efflux pump subunit AcrA (membrane-fusion protein)
VGLAALVGLAGAAWVVGSRAQSPEQAAARAGEPPASYITAKVERRILTKTVIQRGDVRPEVSLEIGAPSSVEGDPVVTGIAVGQGADVVEGTKVVEVSGRPVFVLQGAVPVYRALRPGMTGADVTQLQAALARLGFAPDGDGRFGEATKAAVTAMYTAAGYLPVASSTSFDADLAAARQALVQAEATLKAAQVDLIKAGAGQPDSVIAQAQATANGAQRAVDDSIAKQSTDAIDAQAQLDNAKANYARLVNDPTASPADVDAAKLAVTEAGSNQSTITRSDADAVASAQEALHVAELALDEANKGGDKAQAKLAVDNATAARNAATTAVDTLVAVNGPTVAQGEIVFMPTMPARVQAAVSSLGPIAQAGGATTPGDGSAGPSSGLVSLAGGQLIVTTSIRSSDAGLTRVGMPVELLDENTTTTYPATISAIADQPATGVDGQLGFAATITPDQALPPELSGTNLRVTITAASTETATLVVPLAAVSSSADGATRVSVIDSPNGTPTDVPVTAGLSADGFVAVEPTASAALSEGDLVVVGR